MSVIWDEILDLTDTEEIKTVLAEKERAELIALGLSSWASCILERRPETFGKVMALLGQRLCITPLPEEFHRLYEEWRKEIE